MAIKTIFFDAAGTLMTVRVSVGHQYALVGRRVGLHLDEADLETAFAHAWKGMPPRETTRMPREDDDKGWWQELVDRVFDQAAPHVSPLDRDMFFEVAYAHFAEAEAWELFPEVVPVLQSLSSRFVLGVISNFDERLRMVLTKLGVARFFRHVVISSEVGADKPDPYIFQRALELAGCPAAESLYVGDDPRHDWEGAAAAGMPVFRLERPRQSLRDLLESVVCDGGS